MTNSYPMSSRRGFLRAATSLVATAALTKAPVGYGKLLHGHSVDAIEGIGVPELFVEFYDVRECLRATIVVIPMPDDAGGAMEIVEHLLQTPIEGFQARQVCPLCNKDVFYAAPIECRIYPSLTKPGLDMIFNVEADSLASILSSGEILADDAPDEDIDEYFAFSKACGDRAHPIHDLWATPSLGNEAELFSALNFAIRQALHMSASADPTQPVDSLVTLERRLMESQLRWEFSRETS